MLDHNDIQQDSARPLDASRDKRRIKEWLGKRAADMASISPADLDPTRPFAQYGIKSIQLMQIVGELSETFGLDLCPTLGFDHPTVDLLAEAVADDHPGRNLAPTSLRTLSKATCSVPRPASASESVPEFVPESGRGTEYEQIAVIGMWCRFPGNCDGPDAFWDLLIAGKDAITPIPEDRFDAEELYDPEGVRPGKIFTNQGGFLNNVDLFDADFFGISPREAIMTDPQQRILLETAWHALEHAGINPDSLRRSKTGIFIGASGSDYGRMVFNMPEQLNLYSGTGASSSILSNRISYALGTQGPSMTIDTACSSSLVAMHTACRSLQSRDSDLALAGGVNLILSPEMTIIFSQARLMAPDGRCKVFDESADGYVRSEGCGVLVLKRLADAERDGDRIWGTVLASQVNQDGQSNGLTVPNGEAQQKLLDETVRKAGIAPYQVSYLEAHGTGTRVGDPIEVAAASAVLGQDRRGPLLLGSVKSNIGHLEQAAGMAGIIKVLLSIHHGVIPPNLHFSSPNPLIDLNAAPSRVPVEPTPWDEYAGPLRIAGVSGFSFGGTNAHVLLAEPPARSEIQASEHVTQGTENILCLAARTETDLRRMAAQYADWLADETHAKEATGLNAICREAATRRASFSHRLAVTGSTAQELKSKLDSFAAGSTGTHAGRGEPPRTAFLFTGQGAQYVGMGSAMYNSFPRFRQVLDECAALLRPHLDYSLLDVILHAPDVGHLLDQTAYTQPALFSLEYALASQLEEWGIVPDMVMGHSVGEYAAACYSGLFSLEDAIRLIAARGRLIQSLPDTGTQKGAMAAVFASADEVKKILKATETVCIAAENGPENTVVSGLEYEMESVVTRLESRGIRAVRLTVSHAFHSPLMDPILDTFEAIVSMATFGSPRIPLVSNVTGTLATPSQMTRPSYWREHIRKPVLFMQGMRTLRSQGAGLFVEIGPHPVLTGMGRTCLSERDGQDAATWVAPMLRTMQDLGPLAETLAALHAQGVKVDWNAYYGNTPHSSEPLPVYPFDHKSYWLDVADTNRPAIALRRPQGHQTKISDSAGTIAQPSAPAQSEPLLERLHAEPSDEAKHALLKGAIEEYAAQILLRSPEEVSNSDRPLIRMGLDSLMAVQLKAALDGNLGTNIPLTDFLADRSIGDLARDILGQLQQDSIQTRATEQMAEALPRLTADQTNRHAPFPLTDVQHAYWAGRQPDMELGGVSCQVYAEVDVEGLDTDRLEEAVNALVQRHDMLRAVMDEDGMQRVLPDPGPYSIRRTDLSDMPDTEKDNILSIMRGELSRQVIDPSSWPLFDIRATHLAQASQPSDRNGTIGTTGTTRLHVTFDMLIGDGMSFMILIDELETLYLKNNPDLPPLNVTFRDYVLAERDLRTSPQYKAALDYWRERLDSLPPAPQLPLARPASSVETPVFSRLRGRMDKKAWIAFREQASQHGLTPSAALLAAFGEVLAAWSASPRFSINLTMFNRLPVHEDIGRIVGDFTTLSLLEADIANAPFATNAEAIQTRLWKDMEHRHVSAITVMREMRKTHGVDTPGAMPVVFTSLLPLTGVRGNSGFLPSGLNAEVACCISQTPQVWLDHQVYEEDGELRFNWDYVADLFPEGMLDDMLESYLDLLHRLAKIPDAWQEPLPDLAPQKHLTVVRALNAQTMDFPGQDNLTLHGLFEQGAKAHADKTALVSNSQGTSETFTYADLDGMASRIAATLAENGTKKGELVAVLMRKGWEQIAAVLGILKAGAAYMPIEAEQPVERIHALLREGRVRTVLTQPELHKEFTWPNGPETSPLHILAVEKTLQPFATPADVHLPDTTPSDLAYVIFTSGSTGKPKGVVQDHQSVVNTVLDINRRLHLGPDDAILGVSNLNFDLSVYDMFGAFAVGATLVLPDAEQRREPAHWQELMRNRRITVWNSAPALMQMLADYMEGATPNPQAEPPALRWVLMSGDWIPVPLPGRIRAHFPKAEITSLGGATEAAIWSISHPATIVDESAKSIPYGTPLTNQKLMVLDERFRICPPWREGQLYIGGKGLALGYYKDEERTSASFVRHPQTGERLYRTGDQGRYRNDGVIEFIGRADFQIKIRGHRIEPGEIEYALKLHPEVSDALVLACGEPGRSRRLVAYVRGPQIPELDAHVQSKVPPYMVPSEFIFLNSFPLTPSGKIDRKALPSPAAMAAEHADSTRHEEPDTEREAGLLAIWREVMDAPELGVTDDFFASGGDSLLATRIVAAVRKQLHTELSLNAIFTAPTVRETAVLLDQPVVSTKDAQKTQHPNQEHDLPALVPAPAERLEPFALTDIQHAYWMGRDAAFELGNVSAHFYYEIENTGLDILRLEQAWKKVVDRHDMLRAIIRADGRQQVLDEVPDYAFRQIDLRGLDADDVETSLLATREEMSNQKLTPNEWPLFDIRVSRLPDDRVRVHIDIDNVIADAWSLFTFLKEWADYHTDPALELPPVPLTFRDYVRTTQDLRNHPAYERDKAYWQERIPTLPPAPEFPLACDPSEIETPRFRRISDRLDRTSWEAIKKRAAKTGLTPSSLLISAYAETLSRWSVSPHFTVNVTLFNRLPLHPEVDKVVGDFTSLNLLEVDRSAGQSPGQSPGKSLGQSFLDHARQDQSRLWQDMDHRLFSGVEVMREIARSRGTQARAVMPVVFTSALLGSVGHDAAVLTNFGDMTYSIFQTPQVWLDHQVYELDGELVLNWDYIEGLFPEGMPADMFAAYTELLRDLAASDAWDKAACRLPDTQAERIKALNATDKIFPSRNATLHGLFTARAQSAPDAPAIVQGDAVHTYGELDAASAAIAGRLVASGVEPGQPVAVILEKGPAQVQAVLGILRAGAAYLPMVPPLPPKRLRAILADSKAAAVLTSQTLAEETTWPEGMRILTMEGMAEEAAADIATARELPAAAPDDLAYIIYTSGSTGTPKGVAINHKGAVNTILDINDRFDVTSDDRTLALSSLGFDLSVYDIFGLLAAGGAIVFPDSGLNDPGVWLDAMQRHNVTLWNSAPALMQMMHTYIDGTDRHIPSCLRLALLSGDWIPMELPEKLAKDAPNLRVISLGGATEASIWSVLHPAEGSFPGWNSVPYGRPMANQRMYVLDGRFSHRPEWVPGDLYIAGEGLALGYWNDPTKTGAAFLSHPKTGERLYRTGDLARYRPEGELEFLGRTDHQIKIRGHRVEPGEIEAAARSFPGVKTALVLLRQNTNNEQALAAYLVAERDAAPDMAALRAHLEEQVPSYMVPSSIMLLDKLPVTANGKVDRAALPEPKPEVKKETAPSCPGSLGATDPLLSRLLSCIRDVVQSEDVDPDANFFEIGLTSFHLVQVQAAMREKEGREIPIADFFMHPTAGLLAASFASTPENGDNDDNGEEGAQPTRRHRQSRRSSRAGNRRNNRA